ncbi:hypothetical protein T439DRAFT_326251 [Meredithblackwellia eburnea MCA 4105]
MFKTVNPYDVVVAKATDEKLTGENWEIYVAVWDKVNEDGEAGARNCVAALQKRLTHRNANVQLFALSLAESLVANCGPPLHREICGRAFTSTLVRMVNDRNTNESVKRKVLSLVNTWVKEHGKDPNFELMVETYDSLKQQNHKLEPEVDTPYTGPSDEQLRREEEELQKALEESAKLADPRRGFKPSQPPAPSSNYNQSNGSNRKALPQEPGYHGRGPTSPVEGGFTPPSKSSVIREYPAPSRGSQSSYRDDRDNDRDREWERERDRERERERDSERDRTRREEEQRQHQQQPPPSEQQQQQQQEPDPNVRPGTASQSHKPSKVRALYDFETETPQELPLKKGDIIKVISCTYPAWWLGELRGRQGIFPTSYVEEMPEPPPATLAQEAEMEAQLFAQSASIDHLLTMMRGIDPASEDLAQNEELLELYQHSMSLRPKVVKLLDKYNKKQMELRAIHEKFDHAKQTYEKMLSESQSRYHPEPVYAAQPGWGAYPIPATQQAQMDPNALAGMNEQQRLEYQQQWAAYELQVQQYNAQQAAAAQYYAQQQQGGPPAGPPPTAGPVPGQPPVGPPGTIQSPQDPQIAAQQFYAAQTGAAGPSQPQPQQVGQPPIDPQYAQYYAAQAAQAAAASGAPPQPQAAPVQAPPPQDPNQPYWDPHRNEWIYPAQPPPPADPQQLPPSAYPDPSAQAAAHAAAVSPPPGHTSPPPAQNPTAQQLGAHAYQLVDQMQALSVAPNAQQIPAGSPMNQYPAQQAPAPVGSPHGQSQAHTYDPRGQTQSPHGSMRAQSPPATSGASPVPIQQAYQNFAPNPAQPAVVNPTQAQQDDNAAQWAAYHQAQAAYEAHQAQLAQAQAQGQQPPAMQ